MAATYSPSSLGISAPGGGFQNGGWYSGRQYWNGALGDPGVIINPNQQGSGNPVSAAVVAQTNPNNVAYVNNQRSNANLPALPGSSGNNNGNTGSTTSTAVGNILGNQPTVPNLQSIYDQYYTNNANVKTSQGKITDLQNQLTQRQQALDEATKNINDNPFYSEATRTGKISQLNNEAQNDMNTLNNQLTTEQTNLSNMEAEAQRQVNLAQGQYTMDNQQWQQNMTEFNTLLSAGGLENADSGTLNSLSVSTGIPIGMLQSIQTSQQAKNTQVITSTDNNGNVTVVAVNATTGKVVNSTSLGAIGVAKTGTASQTKAQNVAQTYMNLQADVKAGADLKDLVGAYAVPGGLSTSQVLQAYNNLSPWGAAKENTADIAAGNYANNKGGMKNTIKGGATYVKPAPLPGA